jgi:hypothetical protein
MEHQVTDSNPELKERSWKEIFSDIVRDIEKIVQNEIRLAGVELRQKLVQGGKAGAILAGAGVMGFFAMACMITACVAALHLVVPLWLAAVVMGALLGAGAGGAYLAGRMMMQEVDLVPRRTVETLKEDIDWVKARAATK